MYLDCVLCPLQKVFVVLAVAVVVVMIIVSIICYCSKYTVSRLGARPPTLSLSLSLSLSPPYYYSLSHMHIVPCTSLPVVGYGVLYLRCSNVQATSLFSTHLKSHS